MTREEAIKQIKYAMRRMGEDTKEALTFMVPELNESEDERIWEALIWHLKADADFISNGVTKAECIAYLEKQKINTEGDFARGYDCGYEACLNSHGAEWFEKQKHPNGCFTCDEYKKGYEEGRRNGFTAGYNKAMKEVEQTEQKPTESISQLTVKGKGVYKICPHCKSRMIRDDSKVYTSIPPQYGYNCPKCGAVEFDTVIYDNPEIEEQKQECSDDERIREDIIALIKFALNDGSAVSPGSYTTKEEAIAYLEKLEDKKPVTIEQVYEKFLSSDTLKLAKENKYIRAQLFWELMHNGIITEVDYLYLTDDKRKPWTEEEYLKAYRNGFDASEQLKNLGM